MLKEVIEDYPEYREMIELMRSVKAFPEADKTAHIVLESLFYGNIDDAVEFSVIWLKEVNLPAPQCIVEDVAIFFPPERDAKGAALNATVRRLRTVPPYTPE
ncbi:hypothetical protein [Corynebacterium sp. H127]|uniref:hypothetical protein n=1 Tax=Corynebacterium sp. H127 TaxID=3133418 RepID=UPI0030DC5789